MRISAPINSVSCLLFSEVAVGTVDVEDEIAAVRSRNFSGGATSRELDKFDMARRRSFLASPIYSERPRVRAQARGKQVLAAAKRR